MQEIKIFISSPGDVQAERGMVDAVIARLQGDYWNFVRLEPVLWEHEATRASAHFNEEIISPAHCDIVLAFLWTRLGSRMPPQFTRKDGSRFDSGTEWEIVTAVEAHAQTGRPDLMVYRRFEQPPLSGNPARRAEAIEQRARLERFWREWFLNDDDTIRRAFVAYEDHQQLAPRLTEQLRKLIHRRLPASVPAYDVFRPEPLPPGSPFRGLHAFGFEDAPLFFGRSRAVAGIARQFETQAARADGPGPFVLLLGGSGSGKSSLARAGVAARLTHPNTISGVDEWRRADCHPSAGAGRPPLDALAGALLTALPELAAQTLGDGLHALDTPAGLAAKLADPEWLPLLEEPLRAALDAAAVQSANGRAARLFLVVDQLEELFTDKSASDAQRESFVHALAFLAGTRAVWIAATMRSEFFARAIELPALRLLMRAEGSFTLLPPDAGEISQIVRYPAAAANLAFERHPQTGESLADAIHAEATRDARALPLLEFLLQDLYEHKDGNNVLLWRRYEEVGKLSGALVSHADAALRQLHEGAERDALDLIFLALVTMDDQEQAVPTRNRAPRAALESLRDGAGARALEVFIAARLFVTDSAEGAVPVVSLAHEALLAHWPYLQEFVRKHAGLLRSRRRLADLCNRWRQRADYDPKGAARLLLDEGSLAEAQEVVRFNPPDLTGPERLFVQRSTLKAQSRLRRLRVAVGVFAVLAALAIAAGLIAWRQRQAADRSARAASESARAASESANRATDALANSDFREAASRLKQPEFTGEALALLARAARAKQGQGVAAERLWTLFQQRDFWIEVPGSAPPPAEPPAPAVVAPDPLFATVKYGKLRLKPAWFARSADGRFCVTTVNGNLEDGPIEIIHFRVWKRDGTPVTPWLTVSNPERGRDVRALPQARLSDDGRYVAVVASVWREPQFIEVWDTRTSKRIGTEIVATGDSPQYQNVPFSLVRFLPQNSAGNNPDAALLLVASGKGDAAVYSVSSELELLGKSGHHSGVLTASVDGAARWLMSASEDNQVRVCDLTTNKLIGSPLNLSRVVRSLDRIGPDRLRVRTVDDAVTEYRLWHPLTAAVPPRPRLLPDAELHAVENAKEGGEARGPNQVYRPTPGTVLATSTDGKHVARLTRKDEVAVSDGASNPRWTHRFPSDVVAAGFTGKEAWLMVQTDAFLTEIWNVETGKRVGSPIEESRLFAADETPSRPLASTLGADGDKVLTRSFLWVPPNVAVYWFTVWDLATGIALVDRVRATDDGLDGDEVITRAGLEPEGALLLLGSGGEKPGPPKRCLQLAPPAGLRPRLPEFAEALGGLKAEDGGGFSVVPDPIPKTKAFASALRGYEPEPGQGR